MNALEGSEEWQFFLQYRLEGFAMASGPPSEVSTMATVEERGPKLQKLSDAKSGNGKGASGAPGSSGDGAVQQAPKRQHGSWGPQAGLVQLAVVQGLEGQHWLVVRQRRGQGDAEGYFDDAALGSAP